MKLVGFPSYQPNMPIFNIIVSCGLTHIYNKLKDPSSALL